MAQTVAKSDLGIMAGSDAEFLENAHPLECVNAGTWFGEIPFGESAGKAIGYKFVIFPAGGNTPPRREGTPARPRLVTPDGCAKWRDRWEE